VSSKGGLLAGLRVLDLSVWRPGPYATQLLAEIGADILKIEPPGGDPMRAYPELFAGLSANKRSVVLNLKNDDDRRRALELASSADVVIEGFRPGVVARLGVGYDNVCSVNPSIVYCSLSGMGQTGPLALAPAHDLNYQAWSGALRPEGNDPVVGRLPIADLAGGVFAAFAICAAVVRRERTGEGEYIDVSMSDVLATWTGAVPPRAEGVDPAARGVPGYGLFETADEQHLALSIITENHFWSGLCDVLGLDDVRDLSFVDRMARIAELQERIAEAIRRHDRDPLVELLLAADAPAAPVLDRDGMLGLAHFRQRGVSTADLWAEAAVGYPVTFSAHPAARTAPPPTVDQHRGSGFSDVSIRGLETSDDAAADAFIEAELGGRMQARLGELHDVLAFPGFGAWEGDRLVGIATRTGAELAALAVASDRRGLRIGAALVEAAAADAASDGQTELWLVTTNDNLDAIRLYQRHGFRLTALHAGAVDRARELKPSIPLIGKQGIPMRDELVFSRVLAT
jgi:crotonobetainyl-CoA:carnitine CoA-transferase CaiB-like acyl-CoA transferase